MSKITITSKDALIIVDLQNDFCPGGALAVAGGDEIVPLVNDLASGFEHVVLTQDWHPDGHVSFATSHGLEPFRTLKLDYGDQVMWPDHCVQGTPGADFHPALDVPHARAVIRKGIDEFVDSYSGFVEADRKKKTGLASFLREHEIQRVFVVGLALDYCVAWTAKDAAAAGFETFVVTDATRGIADDTVAIALADMDHVGVRRIESDDIG